MKNSLLLILIYFLGKNIYGQNTGIGSLTPANKLEVESAVTLSAAATIKSSNTGSTGTAIYGISNSIGTSGVQGTSNFGTGVYGFSNNNTAIYAGSTFGTSVYASSVSGIGLNVSGKLFFNGLNTNPSLGAVLTSDATGNAVWKPKQIGFFANTAANTSIPISTFRKVEFSNEEFDHKNDFVPYPGSASPSTSVFTAPVSGIYHFASSVTYQSTTDLQSGQIRLVKNASSTVLANYESAGFSIFIGSQFYRVSLEIEGDFHLNANDKVWIEVAQRNILANSAGLLNSPENGRFSGHLKIAD